MAASVYPEMSFISFEKNMAHPLISTHDPLEVFNSAVPSRQQWRQLQILDYITGLIYIQFYKLLTIQGCLTNNQNCIPVLQKNLVIKLRIIFVMLTCAIDPRRCPCRQISSCGLTTNSEDNTPISFHMTETHVQNIRTAIEMVMSNPNTENVDALFNLLMDLATTNNSTSSFDDGQTVQQKNVIPVSKFMQPQLETSQQHNIIKTDKDGTLNPSFMSFTLHPIVPYSHFQWPVYPKLLHHPNSEFV
jgi:hypothetical protein